MRKKINKSEPVSSIRPIAEMSEKQVLADRFRKLGLDCAVDSGVIKFYVGLDRKKEVQGILKEAGYDASWGVYPLRS